MDSAMRMDVVEARRAVSRNTIVLIASAPQYPHGVVDPVTEIAALALEHNLPCHVDACMGGFLLPWVEKLGVSIFLFRQMLSCALRGPATCLPYRADQLMLTEWRVSVNMRVSLPFFVFVFCFFLYFVWQFPVPLWDFRVPGVTSISADVHKYGYAAKGASTISWISQEYRQYQFFAFAQWPGGWDNSTQPTRRGVCKTEQKKTRKSFLFSH